MGPRRGRSTGTCSSDAAPRGRPGARARPEPPLPRRARALAARRRAGRVRDGSSRTTPPATCSPSPASRPGRRADRRLRAATSPGAAHGYRVGVPAGGRWREILNTDSAFYGGSGVGNLGGVRPTDAWHGSRISADADAAPARRACWLAPPRSANDGPVRSLAGPAVSARRHLGRAARTSRCSPSTPTGRAVPVRRRRTREDAHPAPRADRRSSGTATCPDVGPGSATATACTGRTSPRQRPPVQPEQAAASTRTRRRSTGRSMGRGERPAYARRRPRTPT